jgi:hypothetical protein
LSIPSVNAEGSSAGGGPKKSVPGVVPPSGGAPLPPLPPPPPPHEVRAKRAKMVKQLVSHLLGATLMINLLSRDQCILAMNLNLNITFSLLSVSRHGAYESMGASCIQG